MVVQIDRLERMYQPDSDDVNLKEIWCSVEEPTAVPLK